jgi:hypothetical protein
MATTTINWKCKKCQAGGRSVIQEELTTENVHDHVRKQHYDMKADCAMQYENSEMEISTQRT